MRDAPHGFNGWVDDVVTGFHASGTPKQVADFLAAVTRSLADLPVDRLEVERRVLAAEESQTASGWLGRLQTLRFGPAGYGLVDTRAFGVDWLDPESILEWSAARFTSGNAVLWLSGPPPEELSLHLPQGTRIPAPTPEPLPEVATPCEAPWDADGAALSILGDRTDALHAAFFILGDRALAATRHAAGVSYAPNVAYEPLDGRVVHAGLSADCRTPDVPELRRILLETVDALAEHGPTDEEIERDRTFHAEWVTSAEEARSRLDWHARNELLGVEAAHPEDLLRARADLDAATIRRALSDTLDSLVVLCGRGDPSSGRPLPAYEPAATARHSGREFPTTDLWLSFKLDATFTVGDAGLTYTARHTDETLRDRDDEISIDFADCVAAVRLTSGGLALVTRQGRSVEVHAERHVDAEELLDTIETALGPDLVVPLARSEQRVADAVERDLPYAARCALGNEVDLLPVLLAEADAIARLALARRGNETGLVAVTSHRFLFLFCGAQGPDLVDLPRHGTQVQHQKLRKRLSVHHDGRTTLLQGFRPADALAEVVGLLSETDDTA